MHVTLSSEEEELKDRTLRGRKTRFPIKAIDKAPLPFTDYEVKGEKGVLYTVEIRSLLKKRNTCSCPDYLVNTLSTCKHIEGVIAYLKRRIKGKFSRQEPSRVEIFMDPKDEKVFVEMPQNIGSHLESLISPYVAADKTLLADPLTTLPAIENALKALPEQERSRVRISPFLKQWIEEKKWLHSCEADKKNFLNDVAQGKRSMQMLACKLSPYQEEGMLHLAFKGKAILADDMGLGKTVQAIAACELLRRLNRVKRALVIVPASLKGEWAEQIAKFSGLPTVLVEGPRSARLVQYKKEAFFYLMNYEQVRIDYEEIQMWLAPDLLIIDEAQRCKNWQTKTAWAVKQIKTPYIFVLTGTPIENRIDELYSIVQLIDQKVFGPLFKFHQEFYNFDEKKKPMGYKNLSELHQRIAPMVLRRRKKDVEEQLPERTIRHFFLPMGPEQTKRYAELSQEVSRLLSNLKKRPLNPEEQKKLQRLLACMRMTADTPYILDEECRECPKLVELEEILKNLMSVEDHKVIIFSEWERMLILVKELAEKLKLNYAWHTGSVPQEKRRKDIQRFKEDATCRLFLTTDAGSTGLNLQAANVVINLDLPWNPAKLEQRIARAWRKYQTRSVQVIHLVTENTIEHRMMSTLVMKQALADVVLDRLEERDEMPFPTASRAEAVQQLEALTGLLESKEMPKEEAKNEVAVSPPQELMARFSHRMHLLEQYDDKLLMVVDQKDHQLNAESLSQLTKTTIEVLDFETYQTLDRLASMGLIQLNHKEKQTFFQSPLIQKTQSPTYLRKLEEALQVFKEGERLLRMSNLLKSGGFLQEALPSAKEAFNKGVESLKLLDLPLDSLALSLKEGQDNPQKPELFLETLTSWMEQISEKLTQLSL